MSMLASFRSRKLALVRGKVRERVAKKAATRRWWAGQVMALWERGYDETAAEIIRRGYVR